MPNLEGPVLDFGPLTPHSPRKFATSTPLIERLEASGWQPSRRWREHGRERCHSKTCCVSKRLVMRRASPLYEPEMLGKEAVMANGTVHIF